MLAKKNKIVPVETKSESEPNISDTGVRDLTFKVSPKKAISVYGLQRFPVTLYKDQWLTLLGNADKLKEFITVNSNDLASKEQETL
jgi:hypothetical protein